ncbi:MAG: TIGR02611 family protein [Microbacterium sp.]
MLHEPDSHRREPGPIRAGWRRFRARIDLNPVVRHTYRTIIAILGGAVVVLGLILVPLPGPGWLVVFGGLAILGSEFHWARRFTRWLKRQLERFWAWWRQRRAERRARREAQAAVTRPVRIDPAQ